MPVTSDPDPGTMPRSAPAAGPLRVPAAASRRVALGVVVTLLLSVLTFVIGKGIAATTDHANPGNAWLRTVPRGSVTLVDGVTGRVSAQLSLPGTAGHELQVSQQGSTILVYDRTTGILTRINAGTLRSGGTRSTIPGVALVAGRDSAYLVDYGAATVQRIDLATLRTVGPTVRIGGQIGQAGVDASGALWIPRLDTGQVIPVVGGARTPITVAVGRSDLSVSIVGGNPIVVDSTAGKVGGLSSTGVDWLATLPQRSASWVVPPSQDGSVLPLVSTTKGALDVVDVTRHQVQSVPLGAGGPQQVGPPIADNGRVYLPDYGNGRVLVYDAAAETWGPSFPVADRPGPFDAVSRDGIAYFNNPNGPQTVVVGANGIPAQLSKYTPPAQKPPGSPPLPVGGVVVPPVNPGPPTGGATSPVPTPPGSAPSGSGGPPVSAPPPPRPTLTSTPSPTAAGPPLAPQNVQTAPGAGTVSVSWTIPVGGGPVTGYTLTSQPAGTQQAVPAAATSATVSGLDCATAYQFTVTAVGPGGQASSGASATVHPCTAPTAPAGMTAAGRGDGSIQVNWGAAPGASGYQVSYQGPTSGTAQTAGTTLTIPASSLTYLGSYTVTVYAMNAAGSSSGASAAATAGPPGHSFTVDVSLSKTDPNGCQNPAVQQCRAEVSHDPAYDGNVAGYAPQGTTVSGYCYKTGQAIRNDNSATSAVWIYTTSIAAGYIPSMWLGGPGAYQGLPACP